MTAFKRPFWQSLLCLAAILLLHTLINSPCVAKEVELTKEWQLLGENDTVPAGAHIRMDLSTGGRWAKLPDDEDDTEQVEIDSSGGIVAVKEKKTNNDKEPDYDYEMMHRALSHLPEDEQERMGGLPEVPPEGASDEEVKAFQDRMKDIWTRRQAELQQLQEESMADLPKILMERIKSIDAYLQDPQSALSSDWDSVEEEGVVTHILSVLQDLQDHFDDIDETRDFHTMGGWPLILSLLSDKVHTSPNATTLSPEQLDKVQQVQSQAAWAIGTAVKNIGEFAPWATEEIVIDGAKTTAIDLLIEQLKQPSNGSKKIQKILYAVGAVLRGNRMAQARFCADGGAAVLGKMLLDASQDTTAANMDSKTVKRILALADDVVSDVLLHPYEQDEDIDKLIVASFSTEEYCKSALMFLDRSELQETALQNIQALEPYCAWDKDVVRSAISKVKDDRLAEDDEDHVAELADSILAAL